MRIRTSWIVAMAVSLALWGVLIWGAWSLWSFFTG